MEAVWLSFSDWCSDVVSSDLAVGTLVRALRRSAAGALRRRVRRFRIAPPRRARRRRRGAGPRHPRAPAARLRTAGDADQAAPEGTLFALAGVSTRSRDKPGAEGIPHMAAWSGGGAGAAYRGRGAARLVTQGGATHANGRQEGRGDGGRTREVTG